MTNLASGSDGGADWAEVTWGDCPRKCWACRFLICMVGRGPTAGLQTASVWADNPIFSVSSWPRSSSALALRLSLTSRNTNPPIFQQGQQQRAKLRHTRLPSPSKIVSLSNTFYLHFLPCPQAVHSQDVLLRAGCEYIHSQPPHPNQHNAHENCDNRHRQTPRRTHPWRWRARARGSTPLGYRKKTVEFEGGDLNNTDDEREVFEARLAMLGDTTTRYHHSLKMKACGSRRRGR